MAIDISSHQYFDPDPDVRYVAEHSRCNVMVVEDEEQLNKVENIQDMLPELQAIIQYTGFPRSVTLSMDPLHFVNILCQVSGSSVLGEFVGDREG